MTEVSRADYVKKYMSTSTNSSSADRAKKKKKTAKDVVGTSSVGRGMRLLDEDTYAQSRPAGKSSRKLRREADEDGHDDDEMEEEEEDDEEMDEIERAIRQMNRRSAAAANSKKQKDGTAGPSFKTDSFVTVEGESSPVHEQQSTSVRVKQEVKEEVQSEEEEGGSAPKKRRRQMDDGRRAGLVSKQAMKEELQERAERERRENADTANRGDGPSTEETRKRVTGFNRDRRKRGGDNAEEEAEKEARKAREAAKQAELEQKYKGWNKGLAQIKEREERLEDMEQTLGEGFARYRDDSAMNELLKGKLHEEDPMAEYFRLKSHKVQMRSGVVYPTYKGQVPPNRWSIPPGYRWDGVDRSNGFESKLALEKNKQKARAELTYRSIAECEE